MGLCRISANAEISIQPESLRSQRFWLDRNEGDSRSVRSGSCVYHLQLLHPQLLATFQRHSLLSDLLQRVVPHCGAETNYNVHSARTRTQRLKRRSEKHIQRLLSASVLCYVSFLLKKINSRICMLCYSIGCIKYIHIGWIK